VSFAGRSILFTGDIEKRAQQALLDRGGLHADVLILPHHGSVEPTTQSFIRAVSPGVVVRSTHERTADTVNGLQTRIGSATLLSTADLGAIQVILTRDGIEIAAPQAPPYSSSR
jgi:competence protein ComEC